MAQDFFHNDSICVLGLGYVGLTLAVAMADAGFNVLGVEINEHVLESLRQGIPHFHEPGLKEKLRRQVEQGNIQFNQHIPSNWQGKVFIITVGTPLDAEGKVRLDMITNVCKELAQHLSPRDLVIMRSTVMLGTTKHLVLPILQEKCNDFDLAFCPERTVEGQALAELRFLPQIVGGISNEAAIRASQLFQRLTPTVVRVSDVETAEMIKMVDNASRDVMFAYANEIARITDAIGISAREVIEAGKFGYCRTNLPMPGPVGGPCLAKDPYILAQSLTPYNLMPEITLAARRVNESQAIEVISNVHRICSQLENFPEKPVITFLGIAFKGKPATNDLRGTMAKPIYEAVKAHFPHATYRGFDFVVAKEKIEEFGLEPCDTLISALNQCHLAFIVNNHPGFAEMPIDDLACLMARPGLFYDFWNLFVAEKLHFPEGVGYIALGSQGKAILPTSKIFEEYV